MECDVLHCTLVVISDAKINTYDNGKLQTYNLHLYVYFHLTSCMRVYKTYENTYCHICLYICTYKLTYAYAVWVYAQIYLRFSFSTKRTLVTSKSKKKAKKHCYQRALSVKITSSTATQAHALYVLGGLRRKIHCLPLIESHILCHYICVIVAYLSFKYLTHTNIHTYISTIEPCDVNSNCYLLLLSLLVWIFENVVKVITKIKCFKNNIHIYICMYVC